MKLWTHNMLSSKKCLKGVVAGYPLGLIVKQVRIQETEFNKDFIIRLIPRLEWIVFWSAAKQIGCEGCLTQYLTAGYENNINFLRDAHRALLEVDIVEGELVCPETNRKFPIIDSVPNMLVASYEKSKRKLPITDTTDCTPAKCARR